MTRSSLYYLIKGTWREEAFAARFQVHIGNSEMRFRYSVEVLSSTQAKKLFPGSSLVDGSLLKGLLYLNLRCVSRWVLRTSFKLVPGKLFLTRSLSLSLFLLENVASGWSHERGNDKQEPRSYPIPSSADHPRPRHRVCIIPLGKVHTGRSHVADDSARQAFNVEGKQECF